MPFTPSHAVVALPFVRSPLVPAAIAIGAMTPDLPLFVRGAGLSYAVTHDLRALPLTLLVALGLLLVWRCVLRPAVRELSPRLLATRLPQAWDAGAGAGMRETFTRVDAAGRPRGSVRVILVLLVSLAIGVASHVLWDQFTHEGRAGVALLPFLDAQWGPLTGYKWLQHASSVLGLALIGVWMLVWLRTRAVVTPVVRVLPDALRWTWWLSLPVILGGAWAIGLASYGPLDQNWTVAHLAYRVLPPACAVWGALTAALCVAVGVLRRRQHVPTA